MAAVRVQFKSSSVQAGASVSATFTSSTTGGNAIFVLVSYFFNGVTPPTVTDSKGNTYVRDFSDAGNASGAMFCYSALNISGGASHQVTVTPASADYVLMTAIEVSGIATSSAFDQATSTGAGGAGAYSSGSVTTTQADEYLIGFHHKNNNTQNWVPDSPWTTVDRIDDGTFECMEVMDQVVSSTGSYASTGTSGDGGAAIVTYKASGGGGGGATVIQSASLPMVGVQ